MDWVLLILLFLHIMGAIIAFGPPFSFMILGPMSGREPSHTNFALRYQEAVSKRLILPLAVFQGVTGVLLIWKVGIRPLCHGLVARRDRALPDRAFGFLPRPYSDDQQARRGHISASAVASARRASTIRATAAHRRSRQAEREWPPCSTRC